MIWGLLISGGGVGVFLYLWVRAIMDNGKLRSENAELQKTIEKQKHQLSLANQPLPSAAELERRMREGNL